MDSWKDKKKQYFRDYYITHKKNRYDQNKALKVKHVLEKRYYCEKCDMAYQTKTSLKIHKETKKHKST